MSADQNDLVFEHGIRAWDFGQDVVAVKAVLVEAGADFDAELQRLSRFGQMDEHAVLFGRKHKVGTASGAVAGLPWTRTVPCCVADGASATPAPYF